MSGRLLFLDGHTEEIDHPGCAKFIRFIRNPKPATGCLEDITEVYFWNGVPISRDHPEHPRYDPTRVLQQVFTCYGHEGDVLLYREEPSLLDSNGKPYSSQESGKDVSSVAPPGSNIHDDHFSGECPTCGQKCGCGNG